MKNGRRSSLAIPLLEKRIEDLEAEVKSYEADDPHMRMTRRELRSLSTRLKHIRRKS